MWIPGAQQVWHVPKVDTDQLVLRSLVGMCMCVVRAEPAVMNEVCLPGSWWPPMMHMSKPSRSDGLVKAITFCDNAQHRVGHLVLSKQCRQCHSTDVLGKLC